MGTAPGCMRGIRRRPWPGSFHSQHHVQQPKRIMSLFFCNSCTEPIPAQKVRLRCQQCASPEYDLCANCYVLGQFSGSHNPTHQTTVCRLSGFAEIPAPPPPLPPRVASSSLDPRLSPRPPPSTFEVPRSGPGPVPIRKAVPVPAPASVPAPAPVPVHTPESRAAPVTTTQPAAPTETPGATITGSWDVLFDPKDWQPTESGKALIEGIFAHYDPTKLGVITPEAYSDMLAKIGVPEEKNICKSISRSSNWVNPLSG